jgi:hypothetical protein
MNRTIVVVVLVALLLLGVGTSAAYFGYQAGLTQALAADGAPVVAPVAFTPWAPGGLVAGCLLPLLVVFLGFGLLRLAFGPRHAWHGPWRGRPGWGEEPPAFFQAWHEASHASSPPADRSGG